MKPKYQEIEHQFDVSKNVTKKVHKGSNWVDALDLEIRTAHLDSRWTCTVYTDHSH